MKIFNGRYWLIFPQNNWGWGGGGGGGGEEKKKKKKKKNFRFFIPQAPRTYFSPLPNSPVREKMKEASTRTEDIVIITQMFWQICLRK